MKEIELTRGQKTIIDDEDFKRVSGFKWQFQKSRGNRTPYARRTVCLGTFNGKRVFQTIYLHRFILDAPSSLQIDHINKNGLDNRKANLRLATGSQNCTNRRRINASGFRGVQKIKNKFEARITVNRKEIYLGYFSSAKEAASAYDRKAKELHGEFAILNFNQ